MKRHLAVFFWLAGLFVAGLCFLALIQGGAYQLGPMRVGNAAPRLLLATLLLCTAYLLPDGGRPRKFRVANLFLLFFSVGLCLLVAELGMRNFLQKTQGFNSLQQLHNPNPAGNLHTRSHHPLLVITRFSDDKRLIYELQPNIDMEFGHRALRTNSLGIRADREFPTEKPPGVKRIIGVGDSGMWGWGLDQGQGYMEILEKRLNEGLDTPQVEVVNLAVPGYNTYQELVSLQRKGLPLQPDIVVIGWCDNDFQLPFFMYSRKDHWKQKRSYVYNLLFNRARLSEMITPEVLKLGDIPTDTVDPAVLTHSGEEGVLKSLREFVALGEQHGFRVLLFGPLGDNILELCRQAGLPTLNSYELADRNLPDDCETFFMHPRACGHEILGNFLAERLQELGWL